jgi:ATP-binding protein involved in chromosome partitioning
VSDPRTAIIGERLKDVKNVIAVSSGKGGVGKSLVASVLALSLARKGAKVGLLDLDFTSPSSHVILDAGRQKPKEDKGVVPPTVHGLRYMSVVYYSADRATPLRGSEATDVLVELLAVTRWGKLDCLVLDMPPGLGDVTLDLLRFVEGAKFLVVTTPSKLAFETVRKLLDLLKEAKVPVIGVVENMKADDSQWIKGRVEPMGVRYLGAIPYDSRLEENIGDAEGLLRTRFGEAVREMTGKIEASP